MWRALEAAAPRVVEHFPNLVRSIAVLVPDTDEAEVYIFFYSDLQLKSCADEKFGMEIIEMLKRESGFKESTLQRLRFSVDFDSHERVLRDFNGSYFQRLR